MKKHVISIGMPVFNGEKYISKRLDSILNQSHSNFELIISDNGSTDNTQKICSDYLLRDKRIQYYRHDKNQGVIWNLNFVLEHAKENYFVWASVDDEWKNDFLEKNISILELNQNVVVSMSKVELTNTLQVEKHHIMKKIIFKENLDSLTGQYEQKLRRYLRNSMCDMIYGVFNTKLLKENFVKENFGSVDWATNLKILEKGDLYVIDEVLFKKNMSGISASTINYTKMFSLKFIDRILPNYPLTKWFIKNRGLNLFIKNLDYFFWLNFIGFCSFIIGTINQLKQNKSRCVSI